MRIVPNRLREIREMRHFTLQRAADELGISPSTLSRWETGKRQVSDQQKVALSDLYRVSVPYLFRWEGDGQNGHGRKRRVAA